LGTGDGGDRIAITVYRRLHRSLDHSSDCPVFLSLGKI
jgi:hypothetical protein